MATLKTYALDLTGAKASNKIAGEVKTISKDADAVHSRLQVVRSIPNP